MDARRERSALSAAGAGQARTGPTKPLLAICTAAMMLALIVPSAGFDARQGEPAPTRSSMSGVYTAAQAARGEETYMSICVSCHPPATYTGAAFKTTWGGRPLSDLYTALTEKMPKNDPGSLSQDEYGQVLAWLLKINGNPAGKTELPAEIDALKQIRIETPGMQSNKH